MKKYIVILIALAITLIATTGCWEPDEKYNADVIPVTKSMIQGRTFAQQPYGGTSWGDQAWEQVYFSPSGMMRVGMGDLGNPMASHYGRYTCNGSTRIEIDGLTVFDYMSGKTWNVVAAELGVTKSGGNVLYLGYDNGSGLQWDITLVYPEVTVFAVVDPWGEEITTIGSEEHGGSDAPSDTTTVIPITVPAVAGWQDHYTTVIL